jgi:dinuclear metal center YbgI/SA1388 family protein
MNTTVQQVIDIIDALAPPAYALPNDPIGLHVGNPTEPVSAVVTTLDVRSQTIAKCIAHGASLIVAHHPLIFEQRATVCDNTQDGALLTALIRARISVYVAHTNYDVAPGGVNDILADALGLCETRVLQHTVSPLWLKLTTFVPPSHAMAVRSALCEAGAGTLGHYAHCTFLSEGTGTFIPLDGARPFIGKTDTLEQTPEVRIETTLPASALHAVVQALHRTHPYETPAYDVLPLMDGIHERYGIGRVGTIAPCTLAAFAAHAKKVFGVPYVRIVGDAARTMRTVAVLGGSGKRALHHAIAHRADVLVTGDIDHHTAHDALLHGIALIDAGHAIEDIAMEHAARRLIQAGIRAFHDAEGASPFVLV